MHFLLAQTAYREDIQPLAHPIVDESAWQI
jgi:hypothetical protein